MTKLFKMLILVACMVISFETVDAGRPVGHRWYKGTDYVKSEWLLKQIKGEEPWSPLWNISREEAIDMYLYNLTASFKMAGVEKNAEIGHLYWVIENNQEEMIPAGTVFTNTLVDDEGNAVSFIDTVGGRGEKFFVSEFNGRKIAWAKVTCLQSAVLVTGPTKVTQPSAPSVQREIIVQESPKVEIQEGDVKVNVEAPIVNVIDSTGDTYITNNYIQEASKPVEQPYYEQSCAPAKQCGYGSSMYAEASFGLGGGFQQQSCWSGSSYYGPRGGGGYVRDGSGGGSNSQPININIDVYNNNVNNNNLTNTNTTSVVVPFHEDPHVYHPPTGGGPVDPGNGDPTDGGGDGDGPRDPENRMAQNPLVHPRSYSVQPSTGSTRVINSERKVGNVTTQPSAATSSNSTFSRSTRTAQAAPTTNGVQSKNVYTHPRSATAVAPKSNQTQQSQSKGPRMFASADANSRENATPSNASAPQARQSNPSSQQQAARVKANNDQQKAAQQRNAAPGRNYSQPKPQPKQSVSHSSNQGRNTQHSNGGNMGKNNNSPRRIR